MRIATQPVMERDPSEAFIDAGAADSVARWLRDETRANDVRISAFERLPGGAIQDNWTLDADIDGVLARHARDGAAHRRALRRRGEPHPRRSTRSCRSRTARA